MSSLLATIRRPAAMGGIQYPGRGTTDAPPSSQVAPRGQGKQRFGDFRTLLTLSLLMTPAPQTGQR